MFQIPRTLQAFDSEYTPTKRSDAQPLVEREKQLECLPVENRKSGNVVQLLTGPYVYGVNRRSESFLLLSDLLFA